MQAPHRPGFLARIHRRLLLTFYREWTLLAQTFAHLDSLVQRNYCASDGCLAALGSTSGVSLALSLSAKVRQGFFIVMKQKKIKFPPDPHPEHVVLLVELIAAFQKIPQPYCLLCKAKTSLDIEGHNPAVHFGGRSTSSKQLSRNSKRLSPASLSPLNYFPLLAGSIAVVGTYFLDSFISEAFSFLQRYLTTG